MPLKLLHHKSWHVWKRENIAKVKRDEAKHEAEEREKKRKQQVVDGERRLKRLKVQQKQDKCQAKDPAQGGERNHDEEEEEEPGHINFFQEEEAKGGKATNKDYEAEAKRKNDREMRKMGIAPLGLGETAQKEELKPWYNMAPEESAKVVKGAFGKNILGRKREKRRERDAARLQSSDPLLMMNKYVEQTKAVTERDYDERVVERHKKKSSRDKRSKKKKNTRRRRRRRKSIKD